MVPPRSLTTTDAPRFARSRAYSLPSPRPAPVTIATWPSKSITLRSLLIDSSRTGLYGGTDIWSTYSIGGDGDERRRRRRVAAPGHVGLRAGRPTGRSGCRRSGRTVVD